MPAKVFAICFFWRGWGGGGSKQGASWDNAHMANRVKSTLFLPLEKFRVSARDGRLTGTFSNRLNTLQTTGSPSSKYEHRRASALLRNIQNITICMGKKPIVSVTYENERILIKDSLPYLKCVLRLPCVVHGSIYGLFMGFYINGFLSI